MYCKCIISSNCCRILIQALFSLRRSINADQLGFLSYFIVVAAVTMLLGQGGGGDLVNLSVLSLIIIYFSENARRHQEHVKSDSDPEYGRFRPDSEAVNGDNDSIEQLFSSMDPGEATGAGPTSNPGLVAGTARCQPAGLRVQAGVRSKQVGHNGVQNLLTDEGGYQAGLGYQAKLGNLLNQQVTCYAASAVQACLVMDLHSNLQPVPPGSSHHHLNQTLLSILLRRADPTNPPFPVKNLVAALNLLLPPPSQFILGIQQCAKEFLGSLLDNINVPPTFLTHLHEEAECPACKHVSRRVMQQGSNTILSLIPPEQDQDQPLDAADLVQELLAEPVRDMVCTSSDTVCQGLQIEGRIVQQMGDNTILWICRNTGSALKKLTPVQEPVHTNRWHGQSCVAVLAHCGKSVTGGKPGWGG